MQKESVIKLKIFLHNKVSFIYKIYYCFQEIINGPDNKKKIKASMNYMKECKNKYNGESCFIIGNGPSLSFSDLEKLKGMKCFASNKIYDIFNKTKWRPTFYCISDLQLLFQFHSEITQQSLENIFVSINLRLKYPQIKDNQKLHYILMHGEDFYPNLPNFSDNALTGFYEGYTVTYMMLQLAVHMGFKKIYLLGIDNNFSVSLNPDGTIKKNPDVKNHFNESDDNLANIPVLYKTDLAYQAAKKYADENGIIIYNATRGGKLEVFERVDFDSLFPEDDKK